MTSSHDPKISSSRTSPTDPPQVSNNRFVFSTKAPTPTESRFSFLLAIFSAFAAFCSAAAAWFAYGISSETQQDYRNRTQYHFELKDEVDLTDKDSWNIVAFQISGPPYHIPRITVVPTFEPNGEGSPQGREHIFSMLPEKGRALPYYELTNLGNKICKDEDRNDCKISTLIIQFEIYGDTRIRRLP